MPRPTPNDAAHRLIALACTVLDAPVGLLSLYGEDRTVFRAMHGLEATDIHSDVSVTRMLIEQGADGLIVIPDGTLDARVRTHPLVTGPQGLRFYAGAAVCDRTGRPVGSIGIMKNPLPTGDTDKTHYTAFLGLSINLRIVKQWQHRLTTYGHWYIVSAEK